MHQSVSSHFPILEALCCIISGDTVAGWLQMFETEIGCISESNCEPVKQLAFSRGLLPRIQLEIIVSRCKMVTRSFRRLEFITGPFTPRLINRFPPQKNDRGKFSFTIVVLSGRQSACEQQKMSRIEQSLPIPHPRPRAHTHAHPPTHMHTHTPTPVG